jgi:hypothetical protein
MSVERLDYLLKQGVRVPFVPNELTEFASKLVVMNLAWHADPDGYVWVSDRTQALELAMSRSTVWVARQLLVRDGWLINTGTRKQKGVGVFKLVIPGFSGLAIPTTKDTSGLDSGSTSGLASGSTSGLASGLASGSTSGLFCGLPYQAEKNIKQNEKKEYKKIENQKNELPESVQERIKQSKRSRGINTENSETSLGEAIKSVWEKLEKPNTDQQNNTES